MAGQVSRLWMAVVAGRGPNKGGSTDEGGQGHHDEGRAGRRHVKQWGGRFDVATSHALNTNE